jgi:periplasmic protein TonB
MLESRQGRKTAEMADRTARSLHRLRVESDQRPQLTLIAGALDGTPGGKAATLVAPAAAPPVLSQSSDICGVSRAGWAAAALLYAALATTLLLLAWNATPPEPWPASPTLFKVVFEETPAPPPASAPEPRSASPEAPPEPTLAQPELDPVPPAPLATAEPTPAELPKPPPAKPVPPRRYAARPPQTADPAPSPPAEQQVAIGTPPPLPSAPVVPPQPIGGLASNRKPDYPAAARLRGQQGRVVLRVEVSAAGAPLSVAVLSTSGHTVLDKAALAAVEQWRFKPATLAGIPVAGAIDVPIQFRLEE